MVHASATGAGFIARYGPAGQCRWAVPIAAGFDGVRMTSATRAVAWGSVGKKVVFAPGQGNTITGTKDEPTTFLCSYDRDGSLDWVRPFPSSYEGGRYPSFGQATVCNGCLVLGGGVIVSGGPMSQPRRPPVWKQFVTRHDPDGKILSCKSGFSGSLASLAADNSGRVIVALKTKYPATAATPAVTALTLSCLDKSGKQSWSHEFKPDIGSFWSSYLACDDKGLTYLCSGFRGTVDMDPGQDTKLISGKRGILVARFAADGRLMSSFVLEVEAREQSDVSSVERTECK